MKEINIDNIKREVKYINTGIKSHKKGVNLKSIALEYGYTPEELELCLLEFGYVKVRIKKDYQFLLKDSEESNSGQSVRQVVTVSKIEPLEVVEVIEETPSQSVTGLDITEKYRGLFTKYDVLMKMIEEYEMTGSQNVTRDILTIELPHETKTETRATFRINDVVYQRFKEFADKHKQFTVKELISQALLEFMEKYK